MIYNDPMLRKKKKREPILTILAEDGFVEYGPMGVTGSCYFRFYTESDGEVKARFLEESNFFRVDSSISQGEQLTIRGNVDGYDISTNVEITIAETASFAGLTVKLHLGTRIDGNRYDPTINPYYEILYE